MKRLTFILFIALCSLASCERDERSLAQIEDEQIQAYFKSNNLSGFTKDTSGYYFKVIKQGNGPQLTYPENIFYLQTLKDLNGNVIKLQGDGTPSIENGAYFTNFLGYVTPIGIRESLVRLNKGGSVRTILPSYLAYGKNGAGSQLKGNTVIDVTLDTYNVGNAIALGDSIITKYKAKVPLTFTRDASGVYFSILNPGSGTVDITTSSNIKVAYTGKLFDGKIFDSATADKPLETRLFSLIQGWQSIIPKLKSGGKVRMLIPAYLAYGSTARGLIPANAPLDFEVEIISATN